jgi:hypothetical protein
MECRWESTIGELGGEISGSESLGSFTKGRKKKPIRPEDVLTHSPTGRVDENGRRPSDLLRPVVGVLSKDSGVSDRASALLTMTRSRLVFYRLSELGDISLAIGSILVHPTR